MEKEIIVRNISPHKVDEMIAGVKAAMREGAKLTLIKHQDGSFTIEASGLEGDPTTRR
jgi:hypothetical protein